MASRLFQFIFRSRPAAHIVSRCPGGVGKARDKGAAGRCRSIGQAHFARCVISGSFVGIIKRLLANSNFADFCRSSRTIQFNGSRAVGIPCIAKRNRALGSVQNHLFGRIAAQGHRIIQLHRGGPYIGILIRSGSGRNIFIVPFNMDFFLGYADDVVDVSSIGADISSRSHVGNLIASHRNLASRKDHIIAGPCTVRMGNGQAIGIDFRIPHSQGPGISEIHIFGQLDLQGTIGSVDPDVVIRQFGAVRPAQDVQFFTKIFGDSSSAMVVPAKFQCRCIILTVDGEALQFTGPGGSRIGHYFRTGGKSLGHIGSIGGVGQSYRSILPVSTAPAGDGNGPVHCLGRAVSVTHGGNGGRRRSSRASFGHIYGFDIIVIQGYIVVFQGSQILVVVRYPVGFHRGIRIGNWSRPIAVVGPVLHGRHEDFVVGTVHRTFVDFRLIIIGEHAQLSTDYIQVRRIHGLSIISILVQRSIPHQLGIGIGGGHKSQRGTSGTGRTIVHICIAVLVIRAGGGIGLGMAFP